MMGGIDVKDLVRIFQGAKDAVRKKDGIRGTTLKAIQGNRVSDPVPPAYIIYIVLKDITKKETEIIRESMKII